MFFSSLDETGAGNKYRLLTEVARYADTHGFSSVWTPERHFHPFGGLFPNPSVTSAAVAAFTSRLQVRAGSLISPLHDPVRIAEEWAVVHNLSGGKSGHFVVLGRNVNDFVFFPDRYLRRREIMFEQIEIVRKLWRGEPAILSEQFREAVEVSLYPRPIQRSFRSG